MVRHNLRILAARFTTGRWKDSFLEVLTSLRRKEKKGGTTDSHTFVAPVKKSASPNQSYSMVKPQATNLSHINSQK